MTPMFRRLAATACLGLSTLLPLKAQSYQTQFEAVKYDRSKSSATMHKGFTVEPSTGAVNFNYPLGPGIGTGGARWVPTLHGSSQGQIQGQVNLLSCSPDRYYSNTFQAQPGGGFTFAPGVFNLVFEVNPDLSPFTTENACSGSLVPQVPQFSSYTLPDGTSGSVHTEDSDDPAITSQKTLLPTNAQATALIQAFNYSGYAVQKIPYLTGNPVPTQDFIQQGEHGEVVIGVHPTGKPLLTAMELLGDPHCGGGLTSSTYWVFPEKVLVIKDSTLYEYSWFGNRYFAGSMTDLRYIGTAEPAVCRHWIIKNAGFVLTKVMNRTGDDVRFVYGDSTAYLPTAPAPTVDTVITTTDVAADGPATDPTLAWTTQAMTAFTATWYHDNAMTDASVSCAETNLGNGAFRTTVTYHGSSQGNPAYHFDWSYLAPHYSEGLYPPGSLIRKPHYARQAMQVSALVNDSTQEQVGFTWTTPSTVNLNYSTQPIYTGAVVSGISYPGGSSTLKWEVHPYSRANAYKPDYAEADYPSAENLMYLPGNRFLPSYQAGVSEVAEGNQKTTYVRVTPKPDFNGGYTSKSFYVAVEHLDGSAELMVYAEPLGIAPTTDAQTMQTLADLKHQVREVRHYRADPTQVDMWGHLTTWEADIQGDYRTGAPVVPAASSAALRIELSDRWDVMGVDNAGGGFGLSAVPYPTRTRTWDKESSILTTEERTGWDNTQVAWTVDHHQVEVNAAPNLATEWTSLRRNGTSPSYPTSAAVYYKKAPKTFSTDAANWWIARPISESPVIVKNTKVAGGLPTSMTLPSKTTNLESASNLVFFGRPASVVQTASDGLAITTSFGYRGTTGSAAGQMLNASVNAPSLLLSGSGVTAFGYDSYGYMNRIQQAGVAWDVQQDQDLFGRPTTQRDPNSKSTLIGYDLNGSGRLASLTPPDSITPTTYTYDADALGVTILHGSQKTQLRYNSLGQLALERRFDGSAWSYRLFGYDTVGRKTGETVWMAGQGNESEWSLPNLVQDITVVTEDGGYYECIPDNYGNCTGKYMWNPVVAYSTPLTGKYRGWGTQFDDHGRVVQTIDPNGVKVVTTYAPTTGQVVKTATVAPGTTQVAATSFTSDTLGQLVSILDAKQQSTTYGYDAAGRIAKVTQTDPASGASQVRTWSYNAMGWLTQLVQPESGTTTYSAFTVTGKPTVTNYNGRSVTTTFDLIGRPTAVVSTDGTVNQAFAYDGNPLPGAIDTYDRLTGKLGKLTTALDGLTGAVVERDLFYGEAGGALSKLVTRSTGLTALSQPFTYDLTTLQRKTGYTGHTTWTQGFDAYTGLPKTLSNGGKTHTASYDPTSWALTKLTYGNGAYSTFGYDADQTRLTAMTHWPAATGPSAAKWTYFYDARGNLTKVNDAGDGTINRDDLFSYDALNRLSGALMWNAAGAQFSQSFEYDAFGNRTFGSTGLVTGVDTSVTPNKLLLAYDTGLPASVSGTPILDFRGTAYPELASLATNNRLPAKTAAGALTGAAYDAQGNLTQVWTQPGLSSKQVSMVYDALGRVTQFTRQDGIVEKYRYTDEGLRTVIQEWNGLTLQRTKFNLYDDGRKLVSTWELLPGGTQTWKTDVLYLGGKEVAEVDAAGLHVTQVDHLGSPAIVTNATGTIESREKYLPFGELLDQTGTLKTAKGFTGHEQTDPSGLIYMQARMYLPWVGRFGSPDPARDQHFEQTQSWNIYSYVQNSPTMNIDPNGESIKDAVSYVKQVAQAGAGMAVGAWQRNSPIYQAYSGYHMAKAGLANPAAAGAAMKADVLDRGLIGAAAPGVQTAKEIWRAIDAPNATPYSAAKPIGGALADVANAAVGGAELHAPTPAVTQMNKWDPQFAAQQLLGGDNVTPGGREIGYHAAERMVDPGPGRAPMSMAEVDQVMDGATRVQKVDHTHPDGRTLTLQNQNMSGKPKVVVDEGGKRVVTVIKNN